MLTELIFALSLVMFLHTWAGYPLMLLLLRKTFGGEAVLFAGASAELPSVSVIIPVYNAAERVGRKIEDTLGLDYPRDRFEVIVVSDGSPDDSFQRAKAYEGPNVRVYELERNQGKSAAQNFGVERSRNDLIVFTDIDSRLDHGFVKELVPFFKDPGVACVGGRALLAGSDGGVAVSQGLYWKMEQFIRMTESRFGMLHSLPGWGFAIRRSDFVPLDTDTGDDMILPLEMALRGKRSVISPEAVVVDDMPSSIRGELKARARITLRNLRGLVKRRALVMPWKHPRMAFALWSHKILRWLSPVLLILMFSSSLWLWLFSPGPVFGLIFYVQLLGYGAGLIGVWATSRGVKVPVVGHISSFLVANAGLLMGLFNFVRGRRIRSYTNT